MENYAVVRVLRVCSANAVLALRFTSSTEIDKIRIALDWMDAPASDAAAQHLTRLLGLTEQPFSSSSSVVTAAQDSLAIAPGDARYTEHFYNAELRCHVGLLWRHDAGNVSEAMVRDGYARALPSSLPSEKVRAFYARLEDEARTARRGMWAGTSLPQPLSSRTEEEYARESACDVCGRRPRVLVHGETLTQCCSEECARRWSAGAAHDNE